MPGLSPLAADRRAISQGIFGVDEGIGLRSRGIVADALREQNPDEVSR